jgi:hypothetical protein
MQIDWKKGGIAAVLAFVGAVAEQFLGPIEALLRIFGLL